MRKIANVGLSCPDTYTQTRVCTYLHAVFTPQGILECRPSLVVTHAQLGPLVMQVSLIHFGSCRTPYPCFHPRINSLVHRVVLKRDLSFCPLFSPFFARRHRNRLSRKSKISQDQGAGRFCPPPRHRALSSPHSHLHVSSVLIHFSLTAFPWAPLNLLWLP